LKGERPVIGPVLVEILELTKYTVTDAEPLSTEVYTSSQSSVIPIISKSSEDESGSLATSNSELIMPLNPGWYL